MIQKTVKRLLPMVAMEDVFVVTNVSYAALVKEQLPQLPEENILLEPCARNTAPCIGLAAAVIRKKYGEAMMLVLPSDHLIRYEEMYVDTLRQAVAVAEKEQNLVTIGITPTYPETGYGYINFERDTDLGMPGVYRVERFVEKPDLDTAKEYLASHRYLWNSGMFMWKISTILDNMRQFMPSIYQGLEAIKASIGTDDAESVLESTFTAFPSESIDYGIMEKAKNIYILPGAFGWDDVGSWLAVGRIRKSNEQGNVVKGNIITVNTKNCIIEGGDKLIATVGLEDLIIVDTPDATLICEKNSAGDIKKVLENLKICNRDESI